MQGAPPQELPVAEALLLVMFQINHRGHGDGRDDESEAREHGWMVRADDDGVAQ